MRGTSGCDNGPREYVSALFHVEIWFLRPKWYILWKCGHRAPMSVAPNLIFNTPSQIARCNRSWNISWRIILLQLQRSDTYVMSAVMMFTWIICQVILSWIPYHSEVFVVNLITRVEVTHLHRAISVLFDGTTDNASCGFIVAVDGGWWLWMAKFL